MDYIKEKAIHYKFVFKIFGDDIDIIAICNKLNFSSYEIRRKGEISTGYVEIPHDMVIFRSKYYDFNLGVEEYIAQLYSRKEAIKEIKKLPGVNMYLCCYICSEMGQIGFTISSKVTNWLSELELDLNIDILSYGMVET